jgi:hypothetical protein
MKDALLVPNLAKIGVEITSSGMTMATPFVFLADTRSTPVP